MPATRPAQAPVQSVNAAVVSAKRKQIDEPGGGPIPISKKPRLQDESLGNIQWAGALYSGYVMVSVGRKESPLDFITFFEALPHYYWDKTKVENVTQSCMDNIRAIEEKNKRASGKHSTTEKIAILRSALDIINTTLPDIEHTSSENAKQLVTTVDGLFLTTLTGVNYCRSLLEEHTLAMKRNLARTEALLDSLGLNAQQKKSMQQVIDGLEERVEKAEKLEGLFRE